MGRVQSADNCRLELREGASQGYYPVQMPSLRENPRATNEEADNFHFVNFKNDDVKVVPATIEKQ